MSWFFSPPASQEPPNYPQIGRDLVPGYGFWWPTHLLELVNHWTAWLSVWGLSDVRRWQFWQLTALTDALMQNEPIKHFPYWLWNGKGCKHSIAAQEGKQSGWLPEPPGPRQLCSPWHTLRDWFTCLRAAPHCSRGMVPNVMQWPVILQNFFVSAVIKSFPGNFSVLT